MRSIVLLLRLVSFSAEQTLVKQGPYFTLAQKLEKKIKFQLGKISNWFQISNWEKNPVHHTRYFKLENGKNPVQIDRGYYVLEIAPLSLHARSSPGHLISNHTQRHGLYSLYT